MDKTKAGVTGLMQSIKSRVENQQAENEINLASRILGENRVIKDKDDAGKPKILPVFRLNKDTYAMAFKALHWDTQEQMGL